MHLLHCNILFLFCNLFSIPGVPDHEVHEDEENEQSHGVWQVGAWGHPKGHYSIVGVVTQCLSKGYLNIFYPDDDTGTSEKRHHSLFWLPNGNENGINMAKLQLKTIQQNQRNLQQKSLEKQQKTKTAHVFFNLGAYAH